MKSSPWANEVSVYVSEPQFRDFFLHPNVPVSVPVWCHKMSLFLILPAIAENWMNDVFSSLWKLLTTIESWALFPPLSNRNPCRNISCLKNPRAANFSKWTWWNMSHHHHVFLGWLFVGNCSLCLKIVWSKTLASQKNAVNWCPKQSLMSRGD